MWEIFYGILRVPHHIVMDLNNVMTCKNFRTLTNIVLVSISLRMVLTPIIKQVYKGVLPLKIALQVVCVCV